MHLQTDYVTRRGRPCLFAPVLLPPCCLALPAFFARNTFGSGDNVFDIEFVTIGNPGNPADTTGNPNPAGAVDYVYRIGKYEISRDMVEKATRKADWALRWIRWMTLPVPRRWSTPRHASDGRELE